MGEDIFVDQLVDLAVTGSLVRLDFANLSPAPQKDGEQPALQLSRRLIMPIDSFLKAHEAMARMVGLMLEKGTISRRDESGAARSDQKSALS